MSLDIYEKKTGFTCNLGIGTLEYSIGESLVELANIDLDELHNILFNFVEVDHLTYAQFYSRFFKLYYSEEKVYSIHFELLRNTLHNFYNNYDDGSIDLDCKPFPYNAISKEEQKKINQDFITFFSPLFLMQRKISTILSCLASCNDNDKIQALQSLAKSENKKKKDDFVSIGESNLFDFTPSNLPSIFYEYDTLFYRPLLFTKNEVCFPLHFNDVETFCFYELKRLLNSSVNIICCPICNKFVATKDERRIYCSNRCKGIAYEKNKIPNEYYELYRKRYKYLHNYYSEHSHDGKIPLKVMKELKALYEKYDIQNKKNKKILNKYKEEIKKIK